MRYRFCRPSVATSCRWRQAAGTLHFRRSAFGNVKRLCDPFSGLLFCSCFCCLDCLIAESRSSPRCFPIYRARSTNNRVLPPRARPFLVGESQVCCRREVGRRRGDWVTRRESGKRFHTVELSAPSGRTFPPVAVLASAVPVMGFGQQPAVSL